MDKIKHIWFDLDGTLSVKTPAFREDHDKLLYKSYAEAVCKPVSEEVINDFKKSYKELGGITNVFIDLGFPKDYWQKKFDTLDPAKYFIPRKDVYETLLKIREKLPISLFTNSSESNTYRTLAANGIDLNWFTYIITSQNIPNRKPHLSGFEEIITLSQLDPKFILYVGDRVTVDILPAKKLSMQTCLVWGESKEATYSIRQFQDLKTLL